MRAAPSQTKRGDRTRHRPLADEESAPEPLRSKTSAPAPINETHADPRTGGARQAYPNARPCSAPQPLFKASGTSLATARAEPIERDHLTYPRSTGRRPPTG